MKQLEVNNNCSGCGVCVVNCAYLQENAEGNAEPVLGKAIQECDLADVKKIIEECPEGALKLIEIGTTNKKGAEGLFEIIKALEAKCDTFSVKRIRNSDVKLNAKEYYISIPSTDKEYRREYSSESAAKSAAKDEFNRLCYSENAYRPMLKKIFVEYKVNVLKSYYICDDVDDSVYYNYNQQIRKVLADAYAEICDVFGGNALPESWKEFSVYPKKKDWPIESLKDFDGRSTGSGIIDALKNLSHTSLNDYVSDMDFDYDETYVGEGLFGKSKYKDMWYFSGFNSAARSFIDDLVWAIGYMSSDIEDEAVRIANCALEIFEKQVKEALKGKILELKKFV